jgi:hypothetical protein
VLLSTSATCIAFTLRFGSALPRLYDGKSTLWHARRSRLFQPSTNMPTLAWSAGLLLWKSEWRFYAHVVAPPVRTWRNIDAHMPSPRRCRRYLLAFTGRLRRITCDESSLHRNHRCVGGRGASIQQGRRLPSQGLDKACRPLCLLPRWPVDDSTVVCNQLPIASTKTSLWSTPSLSFVEQRRRSVNALVSPQLHHPCTNDAATAKPKHPLECPGLLCRDSCDQSSENQWLQHAISQDIGFSSIVVASTNATIHNVSATVLVLPPSWSLEA